MEQDNFTVLENKAIGRNISMYRKIRGKKALEVAEILGMNESTYTRYERGETAITVDLVQRVAEILQVDPLILMAIHPNNFIENCSHFALHDYHNHRGDEQQNQLMLKLMENIMKISEQLIKLLNEKK